MEKKHYYDLHCHTSFSTDSPAKIKNIIDVAKKRGLDGIAVTDHNKTYKGPLQIDGIDIIPGNEITLKDGRHLLAYFIEKDIPVFSDLEEAVERIKNENGYAVAAHPLRERYEWIKENDSEQKKKEAFNLIDGIEIANAGSDSEKKDYLIINDYLFPTAGSDAHIPGQVGFTVVETNEKLSKENFSRVLKKSSIIIRSEGEGYRKESSFLMKIVAKMGIFLKVYNLRLIRKIFLFLIIRNYFRIRNIKLSKIDFNYKEGLK